MPKGNNLFQNCLRTSQVAQTSVFQSLTTDILQPEFRDNQARSKALILYVKTTAILSFITTHWFTRAAEAREARALMEGSQSQPAFRLCAVTVPKAKV
ncbi:hypothetical protein BaRGS_00026560 [Batillaria attramentaria]|uniref:Uncharacterized protein n=1 Tax=Batillaria attramentaria TaxID=370345 RepID=A0ABD0K4G5_9CAEN